MHLIVDVDMDKTNAFFGPVDRAFKMMGDFDKLKADCPYLIYNNKGEVCGFVCVSFEPKLSTRGTK